MKSGIFLLTVILCFINVEVSRSQNTNDYLFSDISFNNLKLDNKQLFFSSELHWVNSNNQRREYFIKYINEKLELDKFIIEASYSKGFWINQFLISGDTNLLDSCLEYYNTTDFYKNNGREVRYLDSKEFFLDLYTYNKVTHSNISVIGVDIELFDYPKRIIWSFIQFAEHFESLETYSSLMPLSKSLIFSGKVRKGEFKKWLKSLRKLRNKHPTVNFAFNNYLHNLEQGWRNSKFWISWKKHREKMIAENINRYVGDDDIVYGQFGLPHVLKTKLNRYRSFVYHLSNQKKWKNKIVTIGLICFQCSYLGNDYTEFRPFLNKEEFKTNKALINRYKNNSLIEWEQLDTQVSKKVDYLYIQHGNSYK